MALSEIGAVGGERLIPECGGPRLLPAPVQHETEERPERLRERPGGRTGCRLIGHQWCQEGLGIRGVGQRGQLSDGRELFYRTQGDEPQLMAAALRTTPQFAVTSRRALFPLADIDGSNPHTGYDVSPDGRTFAMVRRSPAIRIMVIQNLPGLVRRLSGPVGESR